MSARVPPTWEDRDLPVLRTFVELVEETGDAEVTPHAIVERSGFDMPTVQRALLALAGAQPPFFGNVMQLASGDFHLVMTPTERARRAVALWPTADDLADRFVVAFEQAAADEPSDDRKNFLRRAAKFFAEGGRDLAVEVLATTVARKMDG